MDGDEARIKDPKEMFKLTFLIFEEEFNNLTRAKTSFGRNEMMILFEKAKTNTALRIFN